VAVATLSSQVNTPKSTAQSIKSPFAALRTFGVTGQAGTAN
jgi:hypothetical protein